jgi:hypothetical protein
MTTHPGPAGIAVTTNPESLVTMHRNGWQPWSEMTSDHGPKFAYRSLAEARLAVFNAVEGYHTSPRLLLLTLESLPLERKRRYSLEGNSSEMHGFRPCGRRRSDSEGEAGETRDRRTEVDVFDARLNVAKSTGCFGTLTEGSQWRKCDTGPTSLLGH